MSIVGIQLLILAAVAGGIWAYVRAGQGAARPCPACRQSVAPNAVTCPHCGHRFGPNLGRMALLAVLLVLAVMAVLLLISSIAGS